MAAYARMIQEQLEDGLRQLQHTANQLMHEIASEVWRTAGGDKNAVQDGLLQSLSRDQSLRSLLAHTDERFQALAVRTARLEDNLNVLAEGLRAAKDQLERGVDALHDVQSSPAARGVADIRTRLDEVTKQIAIAFETLAERDRAIAEAVQERVREHGELVSTEAARISAAMEAYVQQGVAAMGQLAGSVESQLDAAAQREDRIGRTIAQSAEQQLRIVDERIRGAIDQQMTSVTQTAREAAEGITRTLEARVTGLAELIRSDSIALREELVRTAATQDQALARTLDERLGRVSEKLETATTWMVDEIVRRISGEAVGTIRLRLDEAIAEIDRKGEDNTRLIQGRLDDAVHAIDRNMVRMSDTLEGQLERTARSVGERTAQAVDATIRERSDETLEQMNATTSALAKMIRSDNESLGRQIMADQEASKQALRAMKELQATLPADVIETVQRRMDDLAESVAKSQEMLAQRIDRMAAKIGERYDNDIQIVIDRMGDAMHALASLGRPGTQGQASDRIDLG